MRSFIHGRPGSKGDPAAAGHIRMPNGFGIGHDRMDFFCLEAEHLRRNHGAGRPRATNIGRTGHHIGGAVSINGNGRAGLKTGVKPESRGQAPTNPAAFNLRQLGLEVVAVLGGFERFKKADLTKLRTRGLCCALFGAVDATELQGINPQLFREFVDHRL